MASSVASGITLYPQTSPWPIPTPQQLSYQGGMSALIHFNMATYFRDGDPGCSAQNWNGCQAGGGCNSSQPSSFAPTNLNISNWIDSMKIMGMTHAVLTAKHGCGFLLWPTKQTLPNGDAYTYHVPDSMNVLDMFSKEMAAAGLGHGFYYSLSEYLLSHPFS